MIRVALLGDVRLNREGLAALLRRDGTLRVEATASTTGGVPVRTASTVDVIVVDATGRDGRTPIQALVETVETPIVALGVPEDEDDVIAFAELGVVGFVERDASLDELVAATVSAAAGEASFPPRIATTLLRRVASLRAARPPAAATSLTVRERQIVQLIAEGLSNKEIAARLSIELATVKNHVHNILEKLEVSRRMDAVARLRLVEGGGAAPLAGRLAAPGTTVGSKAG